MPPVSADAEADAALSAALSTDDMERWSEASDATSLSTVSPTSGLSSLSGSSRSRSSTSPPLRHAARRVRFGGEARIPTTASLERGIRFAAADRDALWSAVNALRGVVLDGDALAEWAGERGISKAIAHFARRGRRAHVMRTRQDNITETKGVSVMDTREMVVRALARAARAGAVVVSNEWRDRAARRGLYRSEEEDDVDVVGRYGRIVSFVFVGGRFVPGWAGAASVSMSMSVSVAGATEGSGRSSVSSRRTN